MSPRTFEIIWWAGLALGVFGLLWGVNTDSVGATAVSGLLVGIYLGVRVPPRPTR